MSDRSPLELIDTHAHLTDPSLAGRLDELLASAAAAGVVRALTVATDLPTARSAVEQAARFPQLSATAGVHPHHAAGVPPDWLDQLERLAADPLAAAVGEIGVDYFYEFAPREVQHRVFAEQLALALRIGKPVIIHSRGKVLSEKPGHGKVSDPACFEDILRILDAVAVPAGSRLTGVFHCFEGTPQQAAEVLARGFLVSFTGSLTFKSNEALRRTAAGLPTDRVMVETDAPYMSPEPHRKVRPCTPAMTAYTAAKLAECWGRSLADTAAATTANARRLFGLPEGGASKSEG